MNEELGKIVEVLEGLREVIREDYRAAVTGVFGSYARGEQKAGSDLDILARRID